MVTKDIAFALRNIARNKLLATISILGLSIGVSACLIIFLIATYELGFDTFQPDREASTGYTHNSRGPTTRRTLESQQHLALPCRSISL